MKRRTSPSWAAVEMMSNAAGLTVVVRPSRTVEGGYGPGGHRVSGIHQHFEPFGEALDIELLVALGLPCVVSSSPSDSQLPVRSASR